MDWRSAVVAALVIPVSAQLWVVQAQPPQDGGANSSSSRVVAAIPLSRLTPDATVEVELASGALSTPEGVWIRTGGGGPQRIDPNTNTLADDTSSNVSPPAPLVIDAPGSTGAESVKSVWRIADEKGVVSRIDAATRKPVAEIYVAAKPRALAADGDAVWVASEEGQTLTRINPHTNVIVETVKVGPRPSALALGEGAVWTLNAGHDSASVSRVDVKTNRVTATIPLGGAMTAGAIAVGEGAVWISAPGMPLVRIDPRTNRVTHRFSGDGGGAVVVSHGSVWLRAGPALTWRLDPKLVAAIRP
jgi:DNA-binding beta-propeller fold protein YncE